MPLQHRTLAHVAIVIAQVPAVRTENDGHMGDGLIALRSHPLPIREKNLGHASTADDGTCADGDSPKSDAPAVAAVRRAGCADAHRLATKRPGLRRIAPIDELCTQHHTHN